jgi:hypothetical protein
MRGTGKGKTEKNFTAIGKFAILMAWNMDSKTDRPAHPSGGGSIL